MSPAPEVAILDTVAHQAPLRPHIQMMEHDGRQNFPVNGQYTGNEQLLSHEHLPNQHVVPTGGLSLYQQFRPLPVLYDPNILGSFSTSVPTASQKLPRSRASQVQVDFIHGRRVVSLSQT